MRNNCEGTQIGKSSMEKKVKEVKAAVSLIIEEDLTAIKQLVKSFTKKASKNSFVHRKRERGSK